MSQCNRSLTDEKGFSLVEVLVAVTVLTVGLLAGAMLAARTMNGVKRSKYMSLASTLASEKIEDLSRWQPDNPQVCVPTAAATVGSLTTDVLQTTTCPLPSTASATVNYSDDVNIALMIPGAGSACPDPTAGCFAETVSSLVAGVVTYTTVYESPSGGLPVTTTSTTPPTGSTFHRRWMLESATPVVGTRRLTVLVTLNDPTVNPPVTFQMSTVRR